MAFERAFKNLLSVSISAAKYLAGLPAYSDYRMKDGSIITTDDPTVLLETHLRRIYDLVPLKNKIVLDIGAHHGTFSIHAAKKGAEKVLAFEPDPENARVLRQNIKANSLEERVFPKEFAVAAARGVRNFYRFRHSTLNTVNRNSYRNQRFKPKGVARVRCITLSDIFELNGMQGCDFLKMDVEGAEFEIIGGASLQILKKIGATVIEFHREPGPLIEKLVRAGFDVKIRSHNKNLGMMYASRM